MHVAVPEPITKRKDIFRSAIKLIQLSKKDEILKEIREEKEFYLDELKKNIRQINRMFRELNYLPKINFKTEREKTEIKEKKITTPIKPKKVHEHEINKLQKEIEELSKKISSL